MQFHVACEPALVVALEARVAHQSLVERQWWAEQQQQVARLRGAAERSAARADLYAERARRREAGELMGSRDAVLRHEVAALLAARGWLERRWRPLPAGAGSVAGRRWGWSPNSAALPTPWSAQMLVRLPDRLGETVRRAAYWTSAPAVAELQDWYDRHGDGPAELTREAGGLGELIWALRGGPSREEMRRRDQARGQIVTTGQIIRDAAERAAAGYWPPVPVDDEPDQAATTN